jgi:hypothetical protein
VRASASQQDSSRPRRGQICTESHEALPHENHDAATEILQMPDFFWRAYVYTSDLRKLCLP